MTGYYDTQELSLTGVARDPKRPLSLRISTDNEPPPAREQLTAERRNAGSVVRSALVRKTEVYLGFTEG